MRDKVRRQMDLLLEYLKGRGLVPVTELVEGLELSKSTVNRYLNELERTGQVHRAYGGVALAEEETAGSAPASGGREREAVLARIGRRAAGLVEDGDAVFVGTGRTCFELYRSLRGRDLVVFTNNIYCAAYQNPAVSQVFILGGEVLEGNVVLGSQGIANLAHISPSKIFFSASAINEQLEVQYNYDIERQYIEILMGMGGKKVFLMDRAKVGRQSPFKIDCIRSVDAFVTNIVPTAEQEELLRQQGTELIPV